MPLTPQERTLLLSAFGNPELTRSIADLIDQTGTGDVVGPASSTDNALVRFDGLTGKLVQDSGATLSDAGALVLAAGLTATTVSATNQGSLKLYELTASGSNYVGLRAAGTLASDYTITLPAAAPGNSTFLKFDGVDYVWASAGGNSFETISTPAGTSPVADSASDTLSLTSTDSSITITGDSATDTINFAVATTAFSIIQTPAGTSPTADSSNDTLTLTSTDGTVTITGNSTTDTINFAAGNVVGPASAVDGRIASFDSTTGKLIKDSLILASKPNTNSISIGSVGDGIFDGATTMGIGAGGSGTGVVSFGRNAFLSGAGDQNSLFGAYSGYYVNGTVNTILGYAAHFGPASGSGNVIIGANSGDASYTPSGGIGLGAGNVVRASNQMVVGGPTYYINDAYFGKGVTHATPVAWTLQGTGGSGTDISGAKTTLAAGKGTGTGTSVLAFATGATLGTGTTLQTLTDRMTIDGLGVIDVLSGHHRYTQIATPTTPASGKTSLYVKSDDVLYRLDSAGQELPVGVNPASTLELYDDFFSSVTSNELYGMMHWKLSLASGLADSTVAAIAGHPGVIALGNGGNATAGATMTPGATSHGIFLTDGAVIYETVIRLSHVADVTDDFGVTVGFGDNTNSLTASDVALHFVYARATSANWIIRAMTGGSASSTTTSTAVTDGWVKLKIITNAAGDLATFYIDGVSVGTKATSTLPTLKIQPRYTYKHAAGTANRYMYIDWFKLHQIMAVAR